MSNLKNLLVYFLEHSPRLLGRTDLMKFVYSFEYYYYQLHKQHFTETTFIRYHYGPNDDSVVTATMELQQEGFVEIARIPTSKGNFFIQHEYTGKNTQQYSLPENAELVACFILDRLGKEKYGGVIEFAYSTPPMKAVLDEEKRTGTNISGRVLDMDQKEKVFKSTRQEKEEARKRLKMRKFPECSQEEYYDHIVAQYQLYEDVRRRTSLVGDC
ncbi:type II toxin-antitoxin system antitoxin SocA domain-containing protein [Paenibacillus sp. NRS-1781]|uniref:type II toxin-antitoxin system antitoxin SocA domain-containing protein n=1 Tax=Paenibacillus sp. NRS-1781 TaxID=3233905 RepID=UPI003D27106C